MFFEKAEGREKDIKEVRAEVCSVEGIIRNHGKHLRRNRVVASKPHRNSILIEGSVGKVFFYAQSVVFSMREAGRSEKDEFLKFRELSNF